MAVEQYEPIKPVVLHAALWRGTMADFADMPDFDELVVRVNGIDGTGYLRIELDGEEATIKPNLAYIVRGITGNFFVVNRTQFEQTYRKVEMVEEGEDGI